MLSPGRRSGRGENSNPPHAHRNRRLRHALPRLPLGHPGALQHRDRLLRSPCRRHEPAGADLCRRGRRRRAHLVRRTARDVAPLRQCAEGRWARARRPRRGVSVAIAGTADRPSGRVSLRPGVDAAVYAVRRGCAGISSLQFRRQGRRHRRDADGRSWQKSATGCRICKNIYVIGDAAPAGTKSFWSSIEAASAEFATVDTSADDPAIIIYTSGTTGNPKGALHAHRVLLGHLPNVEMVHDFLPKPGDVMWTPADWAWIGGLFDALFPAWYHGVPVVGHRARKFEPQAAMQLMADHGVRNVFLPPTALKLMRQADVKHPGVKLRSMLHRRRVARRRTAGLGARDLRHRCP